MQANSTAKLASTLTSAGFMRLIILRICNVGPVVALSCEIKVVEHHLLQPRRRSNTALYAQGLGD